METFKEIDVLNARSSVKIYQPRNNFRNRKSIMFIGNCYYSVSFCFIFVIMIDWFDRYVKLDYSLLLFQNLMSESNHMNIGVENN